MSSIATGSLCLTAPIAVFASGAGLDPSVFAGEFAVRSGGLHLII
jgi:hypothetical protein